MIIFSLKLQAFLERGAAGALEKIALKEKIVLDKFVSQNFCHFVIFNVLGLASFDKEDSKNNNAYNKPISI